MLKRTLFSLFQADSIDTFIQSIAGKCEIIATGNSLDKWQLLYIIFAVDTRTRAIVIPTYNTDLVFYDQSTQDGEIDINGILERAEAEHTRLIAEGRIRLPQKLKSIRISISEYTEQPNSYQSEHYTFYEAVLPIAGSNTTPRRVIAYAKWNTREPNSPPLLTGLSYLKAPLDKSRGLCVRVTRPKSTTKRL